ncbi:Ubiquitin-protein ligase-like protein [Theobroma cacao]|uniref:Ubiquitin-protein ligase-like protein n=1 Tax=Theobroma cacao TaxID=3641 RepID=A0A061FTW2_THECC|nr:Ubiquitin-protein ligase-like protein [Theobroma cacao]
MEKRKAILSTTGNPEPEIEETDTKVDRITSLPKEVMADILSRLTLEEAERMMLKGLTLGLGFAIDKRAQSLELDLLRARYVRRAGHSLGGLLRAGHFLGDGVLLRGGDFPGAGDLGRREHCLGAILPYRNDGSYSSPLHLLSADASANLKCLELRNCHSLKKVEIYAVNLVSLFYNGSDGVPVTLNLPHLAELLVGGNYLHQIYHLSQLQIILSQLESLSFDVSGAKAWPFLKNIPTLSNLKHLELESGITGVSHSFLPFTSLLTAAPLLHTFTLKGSSCDGVGFPLALLEKLMIDPCPPYYLDNRDESRFRESWDYKSAKLQAMELQAKIPPGIEFIVA